MAHSDAVTSLELHLGTAANRSLAAVLAAYEIQDDARRQRAGRLRSGAAEEVPALRCLR